LPERGSMVAACARLGQAVKAVELGKFCATEHCASRRS
jgi:hypothetical protein